MAMASAVAWAFALAFVLVESLHFDAAGAKNYPVSKVVTLLKDMMKQLEKEQDADEDAYSKMACWCETNNKGKTKSIADAEARLSNLDSTIAQMGALSETISGELKGLRKEIAENEKSLEVATALRKKQLAEFNAEEKEMIQSISALKSAVVVISKHHGNPAALLTNKVLLKAFATAQAQMEKHAVLLQGTITPSQKRTIASLLQQGAQQPTSKAYKPQSGQIFGILKQMQETFEADLSSSQKEEIASAAAFEDLKKAKQEEIDTASTSAAEKEQQLAKTDETLAQAKEDKEDTLASLDADQKFLIELKEKCAMTDKEWEERQKMRQTEIQAVSKAIAILSDDDARDLFSKTFNFLQVYRKNGRQAAAEVLSKAAATSPKFSALAASVRLDPFPKVKKAIDDMITALLKEKAEEIKHKDYCLDEFQKNELSTQKKTHSKVKLQSKIAGLKQTIKEAKVSIQQVEGEIAELKTQAKRAEEDREVEKKDFEGVVADQRETQKLLEQALDVLKKVYGEGVVLAQIKQDPPPDFKTYKKSTGSTGVIALINQIIADAKEMEAEAVHDEATAVEEYKKFVKSNEESMKAKDDARVTLVSQKAKAEKDLTETGSELDGTLTELETLGNSKGALHKSCDYTLKNFDVRQEARDQEVDALRKAKAFLSGMKS
jgi:DNA repair exonuclease SbcCD ATPase subunit